MDNGVSILRAEVKICVKSPSTEALSSTGLASTSKLGVPNLWCMEHPSFVVSDEFIDKTQIDFRNVRQSKWSVDRH